MSTLVAEKLNMENAKLVGRFMSEPSGEGREYEELYWAEEDGKFVLYGNDGLKSLRRDYLKRIDICGTDEEAMQEMDFYAAKKWAARFLTLSEYVEFFGKETRLEKIFAAITNKELGEIFHTVNYIRANAKNPEFALEAWASGYALGISRFFPGLDPSGIYEIVMRMWAFVDPVPEYITLDDEAVETE